MSKQDYWAAVIRIGFVLIFYVGLSFAILLAVVLRRGFYVDERAYLSKMMEGTAWRPFVYRVLVPKTALVVGQIVPLKHQTVRFVERFAKGHSWVLLGKAQVYRFEYLVVVVLMTLCLAASGIVWKHSLSQLYGYSPSLCWVLPVLGLVGLAPILLLYGPYPYDPTTVLCFSLATHALVTTRRKLYYLSFALAILNKETALLLPFMFWFAFARGMPRRQLLAETALQLAVWGVWRYYLLRLYGSNAGVNMEFHLFDYNLPFFTYFSLKHVRFGLVTAATLLLISYCWSQKPAVLRALFAISCVFLLPLHVLFAWIDEFRGLLELYPLVFLLSVPSLIAALEGVSQKTPLASSDAVNV